MKQSANRAPRRKHSILALIVLTAALLAAVCLYRACISALPEGITVGGVEVGGLPPVQARRRLEAALEETLLQQELAIRLPEETLSLSPAECGLQLQLDRALLAARHADASAEISLLPYLQVDVPSIQTKLKAYAARYDTSLTQPVFQLEGEAPDLSTAVFSPDTPGQILVLTTGVPELHLDCDAVCEEILHTLSLAAILCPEGQYHLTPEVVPAILPDPVSPEAIAEEFTLAPVNTTLDRSNYTLIHGSYGTCIDVQLLSEKLRQADHGETVRIPIQYLPPEIAGEEAYFQDVLGAYETRHTDNKNRNTNLQLQCDALNGLVLQPGETFSMNGVLGERTLERGYLPAPAYSGNRLVDSPGGGVCQGTTTLYNCVLLADLEVVFRACHGVSVGYVPLGLDAAVNFLTTDFQFRNNFHFPIQLRAWMEDEYVKMQILGTDEKDYYIKMETGSGEDEFAYYARSYKCKYDKQTDELISRDVEAFSTYYKSIG